MSELETKHYIANGNEEAARGAGSDRVGRADPGAAGRPEVLRPARPLAAHDAAAERVRRVRLRRGPRLRRLVDPRLAGHLGVGHAAHADPASAILDPFTEAPTLSLICEIVDPLTREGYGRDPRGVARRAEAYLRETGIADTCLLRPRVRVLRLRRGLLRARPEPLALRGRLRGGPLELGEARARLHDPREGGLLPAGAARHAARPALGDGAHARAARHPVRVPPPRGRLRRPVRDRPALPDADPHGRSGHDLQVRGQERRPRGRQDRDVHAEADLRRQRLGHAHAPVALEGGHAADGRQVGLRGAVAARTRLRRRPAHARAGAARLLRADDELVPPARPGLRGAGQPRLLAAQPLGVHPHPDVLGVAEGEAHRVPLPRPGREPVPRVRGDADGRARRDPARASTRASPPTTTSSRSGPRVAAGAGLARRGARRARARPRVPARRTASSPRS